jgi:hypothetical protein
VIDSNTSDTTPAAELSCLLYELLDAHLDTLGLAAALEQSPRWAAHLDYLRDLQRVGRETLARVGAGA